MGGNTWAAYQCYGDPDWRFVVDAARRAAAVHVVRRRVRGHGVVEGPGAGARDACRQEQVSEGGGAGTADEDPAPGSAIRGSAGGDIGEVAEGVRTRMGRSRRPSGSDQVVHPRHSPQTTARRRSSCSSSSATCAPGRPGKRRNTRSAHSLAMQRGLPAARRRASRRMQRPRPRIATRRSRSETPHWTRPALK